MQGMLRYLLNSIVVVGLSVAIIHALSPEFYMQWAGFLPICAIPTMVMLNIFVSPSPAGGGLPQSQPIKGGMRLAIAVLAGAVIAPLMLFVFQGGIVVPSPVTMMFSIFSVVTMMWLTIVFEAWPGRLVSENGWLKGLATMILSYLVAYFLFRRLFNFAPLGLGPDSLQGLFPAWSAIVFSLTAASVIFALMTLEKLPLKVFSRFGQPFSGFFTSIFILSVAALVMWTATVWGGVDVVKYMVAGPIAFLFGVFMTNDVSGGAVFANTPAPARGILRLAACFVTGAVMYLAYNMIMAWIAPGMASGSPMYAAQIWLADAMLSITFPVILIYIDFFEGWPLSRLSIGGADS